MVRTTLAFVLVAACGGDEDPEPPANSGDDLPECVDEIPYDGVDQDCSGGDLVDRDEDGHDAQQAGGDDCADEDPAIHPTAVEVPYDGIDQDCLDGDLVDADGDGEPAEIAGGLDCDDADPERYPDADDRADDGIDQNCDGLDGVDVDGDGFASNPSGGTDCNDEDPLQNPAAVDLWYDGVDQNCDRACDYDQDGDGGVLPGSPIGDDGPCDQLPGPDKFAPDDCNDLDPLAISLLLWDTVPQDGDYAVPVDRALSGRLTEPYPTPVFSLVDGAGNAVSGVFTGAGTTELLFVPDAPLLYDTDYEMAVTHSCGTDVVLFTTEAEAVPIDPTILPGQVWSVDLVVGSWTETPLLSNEFIEVFYGKLLFSVSAADADSVDLTIAPTDYDPAVQDLCLETGDTVADFTGNPGFVAGPMDFAIAGWFGPLQLVDTTVSGTFQPDGNTISRLVIDGYADLEPLGDSPLGAGDPQVVCDLMTVLGGTVCEECPNGSGPYCIAIYVEELLGVDSSATVVSRTVDEVAADPTCP